MLASKRRHLSVETLEGRALLSGVTATHVHRGLHSEVADTTTPQKTTVTLSGKITGTYAEPVVHLPPGVGTFIPAFNSFFLNGKGSVTVTPPGTAANFVANGEITVPNLVTPGTTPAFPGGGFLALVQPAPTATGSATTAPKGGALFLELTKPTTEASGQIDFNFKIVVGTGIYRNTTGTGTGTLALVPAGTSTTSGLVARGAFTLTLSPPASTT